VSPDTHKGTNIFLTTEDCEEGGWCWRIQ